MHAVIDRIASEPGYELYVRWVKPTTSQGRAVILLNSRSLCVESSMGISMGSSSYADYLASRGCDVFLVDLRGYGASTPIQEQYFADRDQLTRPFRVEDYYQDLASASQWVRDRMGPVVELTVVGFSLMATLAVIFADLHPELVDHVVCLNPNWITLDTDPERESGKFIQATDPRVPYAEVTMQSIENRLTTAQPPGRNFIEPLWFDQAAEALARDHKTFDPSTGTWRIVKWDPSIWRQHLVDKRSLKNLRADVLFIHSQYDVENPYFIVKRLFDAVKTERKYIKVLPNATHLCIWETARQQLYNWTAEFILL